MNVVELKPEPDENMIAAAEKLLERAKAGDIQSLCYTAITADNSLVMNAIVSRDMSVLPILGSIEALRVYYVDRHHSIFKA